MGKKKLSGAQRKKKKMEEKVAMDEALAEMSLLVFGQMTELWTGLVSHHKDIFVSHVLPKLNRTDLFFFSRATMESRALLFDAGVNVLELLLYVHECSSISTLEFVWNEMLSGEKCGKDGIVKDQAWFCAEVASTNKLEFLKWAREVKHCEWDERTIIEATHEGNLEILKYCIANGCPHYESEDVVELTLWFRATTKGHLDCLRFLFDEMKPSREMEGHLAAEASGCGHLDILKYIVGERRLSNGLNIYLSLITCAANNARFHCLDYLLEDPPRGLRNAPGAWMPLAGARWKKQFESAHYLREKGFPEPTNRQYTFYTQNMVLRGHGENQG